MEAIPLAQRTGVMGSIVTAVAYGVFATVSFVLTQGIDGVATVWPASGILLAGLLALPQRHAPLIFAGCGIASLFANLFAGTSLGHAIGFTVANLVEGAAAAALLWRWCGGAPSFLDPAHVWRFAVVALCAAGMSAALAALIPPGSGSMFVLSWFTTDLLGLLLFTPLILTALALFDADGAPIVKTARTVEVLGWLVVVAAVTGAVFAQTRYPLLFLPLVALLAATFRGGLLAAVAGTVTIALIASLMTGLGTGPAMLIAGPASASIPFLQFYLLVLFAASLPLAAGMATRSGLAEQLASSERMHRAIAENATDIIVRFDLSGMPLYVSPAVTAVLGFSVERSLDHHPLGDVHPDDRHLLIEAWGRVLSDVAGVSCTYRQRRADGTYAWLEARYRLLTSQPEQVPLEVAANIRDISERHASELAAQAAAERLGEANRLLSMAERIAQVGHWHIHLPTGQTKWSPEIFRLFEREGPQPPSMDETLTLYHVDDRERIGRLIDASARRGEALEYEGRIVLADGCERYVHCRGQAVVEDGVTVGIFGVIQDVTRRAEAERELTAARLAAESAAADAMQLADTDMLTGVASRRHALRFLNAAVAEAQSTGRPLMAAIFDIDHFKSVNDRFGHARGDQVLRETAQAAIATVRPTDLVGRLGGEEFLLVLPGLPEAHGIDLAERLRTAVAFSGEGEVSLVTISIGLAVFQPDSDADALLQRADQALYRAKAAGRNVLMLAA